MDEKRISVSEVKNEIVSHYPSAYLLIWVILSPILWICLFVAICIAPADEKTGIVTFIFLLAVACLLFGFGFKRYKIVVNNKGVHETPIIGKSKQIEFTEIKNIKVRRSKAIVISGGNKKIYIDPAVNGYDEIAHILKERGVM